MHLFIEPSVILFVTSDIDGNILYIRTNDLDYYEYPDLILEQEREK